MTNSEDAYPIGSARERLLRVQPDSRLMDVARDPGSAFVALVMGGLVIGLLVWLVAAVLLRVDSPVFVLLGPVIVWVWVGRTARRDFEEKLARIRTASPQEIAHLYCDTVHPNEDPYLWRQVDEIRRRS